MSGTLAQKAYLSVIDQGVVSGCNFFTGVLLGRFAAPAEYGVFVIVWTTLMIILSLQNALICTPMSVIGAQKAAVERASYLGSLLFVEVILSVGACAALLIVGLILQYFSILTISYAHFYSLVAVTIFTCFFFLSQEFFRRVLIVNLDMKELLRNDAITNSLRIFGLLLLVYIDRLGVALSLFVIGASFLVGAVIGYIRLQENILISFERLRHDFLENWHFGKWVIAEMLPYTLSVQGYTYLTAILAGVQPTAALGAAQNILNATNVLILSLSNIITPVASERYAAGGEKLLVPLMFKAFILSAIPIIGFYFITIFFAEEILHIVYNQNYSGYGSLLAICSVYFIVSYFNRILQIILYAKKKPNIGFHAKTASFVMAILVAYPLIKYYGVYGSAFGTVVSQIVILVGFLAYLRGGRRREKIV